MITYFVQVNVCWLLFYGAYFALLSRETFFRLNRYWLIISLLAGLILPWIAPTLEVVEPTNVAAVMLQPFVVTAEDLSQNIQNTEGSLFKIFMAIYGLGLTITLGKLLFGLWKIKRLLNRADRLPMDDFTLMQVREVIAPFSFFRWVFININLIEHADLQQIILHERAHVRERHSIDVLFIEALGIVFWWSPLVYFYTKSLKNVHEYAADAAVLRTSSAPQYGRLLLRQQQSGMSLSLTNPFFSQLKKRILMMTRNPSKRRALAKYALAVPIFLVLTLLLASPKTRVMATTEAATERAVASIESFEKNLTAPQVVGNELVMPNFLSDTSITETERIFTLDGKTPSSTQLMSLEEIHNRKDFSVGDLIKMDDGHFERMDNGSFTIVRISQKDGTTRLENTGSVFSKEVLQLVQKAELGDTYQFIDHTKKYYRGEEVKFPPFTYFIGEKPTNPRLDALDAQQKAELLKIAESPVVLLAGRRGGVIDAKTIAAQDHLDAYQVVNGNTIPIEIVSFIMFRVPQAKEKSPMQSNNTTGQFNSETKRMMEMAEVDDNYQFMDVICRVNGEKVTLHKLNAPTMGFVVKGGTPQYKMQKDSSDPVFTIVEQLPEFIGGLDSMFRFLGRSIKYPAEARREKVEGTVYVGFIVEKDGSITNVSIKRNVRASETRVDTIMSIDPKTFQTSTKTVRFQDETCAEEAMRVVKLMPKWKAGRNSGVPIRVAYTLPIKFKLE
jgi:hypothetical protein